MRAADEIARQMTTHALNGAGQLAQTRYRVQLVDHSGIPEGDAFSRSPAGMGI